MRHLSDGALRRLYDEPYSLDEETRAHYNDCADCQARFATVADDARHAMALLAVPAATVDPAGALARVKARTGSRAPRLAVVRGGGRRLVFGGLAAAVLAGVLVSTLAFTPLAANIVRIFQPTQITPVAVQPGDFQGLSAFSNWGDVKATSQGQLQQTETAAEAAKDSGLPVIKVDSGSLPSSLQKAPVSYAALSPSTGTVTFNNNAPAKLRGSTLTLVIGPAETAVYGDLGSLAHSAEAAKAGSGSDSAPGSGAASGASGAPDSSGQSIEQALTAAGPLLAVAEMKAPQVSSTGASVADIKSALLAQPGLSPTLRAAISSFDDPTGNLPIPIPSGYVNSQSVKVQGVSGTAFGDNTGLGSGVVWIKGGRVYAVAGTIPEDQALAVANGIH